MLLLKFIVLCKPMMISTRACLRYRCTSLQQWPEIAPSRAVMQAQMQSGQSGDSHPALCQPIKVPCCLFSLALPSLRRDIPCPRSEEIYKSRPLMTAKLLPSRACGQRKRLNRLTFTRDGASRCRRSNLDEESWGKPFIVPPFRTRSCLVRVGVEKRGQCQDHQRGTEDAAATAVQLARGRYIRHLSEFARVLMVLLAAYAPHPHPCARCCTPQSMARFSEG